MDRPGSPNVGSWRCLLAPGRHGRQALLILLLAASWHACLSAPQGGSGMVQIPASAQQAQQQQPMRLGQSSQRQLRQQGAAASQQAAAEDEGASAAVAAGGLRDVMLLERELQEGSGSEEGLGLLASTTSPSVEVDPTEGVVEAVRRSAQQQQSSSPSQSSASTAIWVAPKAWSMADEGCGLGSADAPLGPAMECRVSGVVRLGQLQSWNFTISPKSGFDLVLELRTLRGTASLVLVAPDGRVIQPTLSPGGGHPLRTPGIWVVVLPRDEVGQLPGNFTASVLGVSDMATFSLALRTPIVDSLLVAEEVEVLRELMASCCEFNDQEVGYACRLLQRSLDAQRGWHDDLCQQPPNQCDEKGRLVRLVLPGSEKGNLVCAGFPAMLSRLTQLRELDLSSNYLIGDVADAAAALAPLPNLSHLYLHNNLLDGTLPCSFFTGNMSLEVLWLGWNSLSGKLPECVMQSRTLVEISLGSNFFTGSIPPVKAAASGSGASPDAAQPLPLELFDASFNGNIMIAGITGTLHPTFGSLIPNLTFVDLMENNITGSLPWSVLPASLRVLSVTGNRHKGTTLPALVQPGKGTAASGSLRSLLAARCGLNGTLPAGLWDLPELLHADLSGNALTGPLTGPSAPATPGARLPNPLWSLDFSRNQLTGTLVPTLAQLPHLTSMRLAGNKLTGSLDAWAGAAAGGEADPASSTSTFRAGAHNALRVVDLSANKLEGQVPRSLAALSLFAPRPSPVLPVRPTPVMDLVGNALAGDFPLWLFSSLRLLPEDDLRLMRLGVVPQAGGMMLDCPGPYPMLSAATRSLMLRLEFLHGLKCNHTVLGTVYITDALDWRDPTISPPPPPPGTPVPSPSPPSTSGDPTPGPAPETPAPAKGSSSAVLVPVAAGCAVGGVVLAAIGFFVYRRVQRRKGGSSSGHSGSGGHDASQYFSNPLAMQGHGVTAAAEGGAHGPLNIRLGQDSTWYQKFGRFVSNAAQGSGLARTSTSTVASAFSNPIYSTSFTQPAGGQGSGAHDLSADGGNSHDASLHASSHGAHHRTLPTSTAAGLREPPRAGGGATSALAPAPSPLSSLGGLLGLGKGKRSSGGGQDKAGRRRGKQAGPGEATLWSSNYAFDASGGNKNPLAEAFTEPRRSDDE